MKKYRVVVEQRNVFYEEAETAEEARRIAAEDRIWDENQSGEDTYGFDGNSETNKQKNQKFFHLGPKNKWQDILNDEVRNKVELLFKNEMKEIGYLK